VLAEQLGSAPSLQQTNLADCQLFKLEHNILEINKDCTIINDTGFMGRLSRQFSNKDLFTEHAE